MNYVIKKGTWAVEAIYPHKSQSRLVDEPILAPIPYANNRVNQVDIMICWIRPILTSRVLMFTSDHLLFKGKIFLDSEVKNGNLYAFSDAGWYGFLLKGRILVVIPENISSLNIKRPPSKKPKIVPFSNMPIGQNSRESFDNWLKRIGYEW